MTTVDVGTRIRRIESSRKNDYSSPSTIDRPFMRRAIDPNRATRDDHHSVEHGIARKAIRKVERFIVSTTGAHDGNGTPEVRQLAHDTKPLRRIRKIPQADGIVRTSRSHQTRPPRKIAKHDAAISTASPPSCVPTNLPLPARLPEPQPG